MAVMVTMDLEKVCPECNESYTSVHDGWCEQCNAGRFQQDFPNWTSGNKFIDEFIRKTQSNVQSASQVLEWVPYNRLKNIKYHYKEGFSTVYKAIWLDGPIRKWSYDE